MKLRSSLVRRWVAAIALAASLCGWLHAATAGELTIYAGAEADNIKFFSEQFSKKHPNIKLNWIRDSTGIIQARVLAEKDNPRADVLFAMAVTSMINLDQIGLLMPYTPKGADKLSTSYLDGRNPSHWTGIYGWASAMCFNTVEARKTNIARPSRWADLVNPALKGKMTMPHPASSGTGYLMVAAWIQIMGEENAWRYMDRLHENISVYSHSGSKPCEQAASGEFVLGLSFPFRAARLKSQGAPIEIIIAEEGTGWEMQTMGILRGTRNMDDAKTFLDWATSQDAMEAYGSRYEVTAMPVSVKKPEHFPTEVERKLIKNDFAWSAKEQPRIITEWRKRYDSKSEPRK
ncbi:MAG: putative 2-aminoethylphosphonate ABC transporter substrate-binding protein [Alphaproteobacteria bacterium]|nr:putative 2-aminoethylphosphonate ABC transporter substrate-binding protein [Alphaproteobacteria bacterium]